MRDTLILAAIAAMAFTTIADAKTCTDPKTHKYVKCPTSEAAPANKPAAPAKPATPANKPANKPAAPANKPASATAPMASATTGGAPHCTKGKPCGKSCIAMDKVCHKS